MFYKYNIVYYYLIILQICYFTMNIKNHTNFINYKACVIKCLSKLTLFFKLSLLFKIGLTK